MVKLFKKIQESLKHQNPYLSKFQLYPFYSSFFILFSPYSQQTSISIKSQHPSYPGFKKKHVFDVSNSMTSYFGLVNEHCSGLILQRKFQGGLYIYIYGNTLPSEFCSIFHTHKFNNWYKWMYLDRIQPLTIEEIHCCNLASMNFKGVSEVANENCPFSHGRKKNYLPI